MCVCVCVCVCVRACVRVCVRACVYFYQLIHTVLSFSCSSISSSCLGVLWSSMDRDPAINWVTNRVSSCITGIAPTSFIAFDFDGDFRRVGVIIGDDFCDSVGMLSGIQLERTQHTISQQGYTYNVIVQVQVVQRRMVLVSFFRFLETRFLCFVAIFD